MEDMYAILADALDAMRALGATDDEISEVLYFAIWMGKGPRPRGD